MTQMLPVHCGFQRYTTPIPPWSLPSPQDWAVLWRQTGGEGAWQVASSSNTTRPGRTNVKI